MPSVRSNHLFARRLFPTLMALSLASGCGDHDQRASGTQGGFTASGPAKVGDGLGSTGEHRGLIAFGEPDGCTEGTLVVLNTAPGGIDQPKVCGKIETFSSPGPLTTAGQDPPRAAALTGNSRQAEAQTTLTIHTFKGLHYAAPPIGDLRWADPQPSQLAEVRGVEYGPKCPQGVTRLDPDADEDCLYLNVWTPMLTPDGQGTLPVMVFIHGGAFVSGSGGTAAGDQSGSLNLYDGTQFLQTAHALGQDVVFVTLNYRLGALGFLAGNGLDLAGNYGIKDQTLALEWVQRNIGLFGGDPERVMIFGESAGAQSTALHLTIQADDHQSLFTTAVMESGYAVPYMPVAEAQAKANAYLVATGCRHATEGELNCLRGLSIDKIVTHQLFTYGVEEVKCAGLQALLPWNPVIDGQFITGNPIAGKITKPVMLGSNLNESIPFLADLPDNDLETGVIYASLMEFLFGLAPAAEIMATYETLMPTAGTKAQFEQAVTDYMWTCFNAKLAEAARATLSDNPVFRYHYVHHGSFSIWGGADAQGNAKPVAKACSTAPNVCHADELPFVFGNATNMAFEPQTFTPDEAGLSTALRTYWLQFAIDANPNGTATLPHWPQDHDNHLLNPREYLQLQAPTSAIAPKLSLELDTRSACSLLWNQFGYQVRSAFQCGSF